MSEEFHTRKATILDFELDLPTEYKIGKFEDIAPEDYIQNLQLKNELHRRGFDLGNNIERHHCIEEDTGTGFFLFQQDRFSL